MGEIPHFLRTRLVLLSAEESNEGDTRHLDNLEATSGDITDGVSLTTETGDEDLIVFVNVVQTTIVGDEGGDLLSVLDELDTGGLTDSRVRLLGLNSAVRGGEERERERWWVSECVHRKRGIDKWRGRKTRKNDKGERAQTDKE